MREKSSATRLGRPPKPRERSAGIRPGLVYAIFAALVATNVVTLLALLMSPDIGRLIDGQTAATLSAYEDRIADLRLDVDRLHSRQFAQTGDINLQLQELAQEQEVLAEQHQYVKALADKAAELGIGPIDGGKAATAASSGAPVPLAPLPPQASFAGSAGGEAAIEAAGHQVRQMMDDSRTALAAISAEADASTEDILSSLRQMGIKPDMPANADDAMGGPLLPPQPEDGDAGNLVDQANDVAAALTRFQQARAAIAEAPIHMPVAANSRISSPFGNRVDPFTGRMAFHPGIDFPWPVGTTVKSAGAGRVVYVGQINGYGNVVDIDHGGGLVTRYGHLSAFLVGKGDTVETGTPIARVGSTGRSTGPHLHFEVRRDDSPVNPAPYLDLGRRLAHFVVTAPSPAEPGQPAGTPEDGGDDDGNATG